MAGPAMIIGTPWREDGKLYNAVRSSRRGHGRGDALQGRSAQLRRVRREARVRARARARAVRHSRVRIGVPICEDIWGADAVECLCETGAEILLVPNGSPFERCKRDQRLNVLGRARDESGLPLVYVNQVGGQDELVFDGGSFALERRRPVSRLQLPSWEEALRRHATGRARPTAGSASAGALRRPKPATPRSIRPWSWACGTM